jgi:very-short-patch-repair endonuclease
VTDRFIEADVWFPDRRLIVELDSRWHDTTGARERDAARDRACRAAGIEVRRLRPYSSAPSSRSTRRRIASEEA